MPKRICEKCGERSAFVWRSQMIGGKKSFGLAHRRKLIKCEKCGSTTITIEIAGKQWGVLMCMLGAIELMFGKPKYFEAKQQATNSASLPVYAVVDIINCKTCSDKDKVDGVRTLVKAYTSKR